METTVAKDSAPEQFLESKGFSYVTSGEKKIRIIQNKLTS